MHLAEQLVEEYVFNNICVKITDIVVVDAVVFVTRNTSNLTIYIHRKPTIDFDIIMVFMATLAMSI